MRIGVKVKNKIHRSLNSVLPGDWKLSNLGRAPVFPELSTELLSVVNLVRAQKLSMTSSANLAFTAWACQSVSSADVAGSFVEIGTWRGGHGVIAARAWRELSEARSVTLCDTFSGMTRPTQRDTNFRTEKTGVEWMNENRRKKKWEPASELEVRSNLLRWGLIDDSVSTIAGKIEELTADEITRGERIAVLRIDVDWYEPTAAALRTLIPSVSEGGVVILDDVGSWVGAHDALWEVSHSLGFEPRLFPIDDSARFFVMPAL